MLLTLPISLVCHSPGLLEVLPTRGGSYAIIWAPQWMSQTYFESSKRQLTFAQCFLSRILTNTLKILCSQIYSPITQTKLIYSHKSQHCIPQCHLILLWILLIWWVAGVVLEDRVGRSPQKDQALHSPSQFWSYASHSYTIYMPACSLWKGLHSVWWTAWSRNNQTVSVT